jgi:aminoglycoside 3-N-acetyltransferase
MFTHLVRRMLPPAWYDAALRRYRALRRARLAKWPPDSEAEFRRLLTDVLGIRSGSVVFVHSSVDRLNLGFSFLRVLPILQETVGPEGTLLFPCTHVPGRAEDYLRRGEVFDVRHAVTSMGVIPELARRHPDACRSLHPTNSVVALGKHARELTETHGRSIYPCGEDSPYYKIVQHRGLIVGLGVTTAKLSFVHCVEDILRDRFPVPTRTTEVFPARVIDRDGCVRVVPTLAQNRVTEFLAPHSIPRFLRRYVAPTVCRDLRAKGVDYFAADAPALYAWLAELASQGVTIYGRRKGTSRQPSCQDLRAA